MQVISLSENDSIIIKVKGKKASLHIKCKNNSLLINELSYKRLVEVEQEEQELKKLKMRNKNN